MYLGLSWRIGGLLEKLGMSEGRACHIQYKIDKFEDWLLRHPITNLVITIPDNAMDDKWHRCTASFDEVKFSNQHGRWRKVITFMVKAKVEEKK